MSVNDLELVCWNVRGLNNPAKRKAVREFISSVKCNIVCLQETKLQVLTQFKLRSFLTANLYNHAASPSDGASGGILVAWDSTMVTGQPVSTHKYHVTVSFSSTTTNVSIVITSMYAPCMS